ncbi:hypothetical protein M413DRAFT_422391 [Hebeloma cylindrosporum]|uniref:HSF-type DNA-binding domain-containing protein n=1 Tax=Hebeloma cylindrosporum TaxID=76867 RepID=A0A0C2YAM3_HEBCY|nr:hypothetical protein M413DRAFT_422391 [Hebeloma cylindrosporum h7]
MLPTEQYSSRPSPGGNLIPESHAEASKKKYLDMPGPFSPGFSAHHTIRGQPTQELAFEQGDELSEDDAPGSEHEQANPAGSGSDFVNKLFIALENPALRSILAWGPLRDCFFVIHRNSANFARQLDEYGFQKVANASDNKPGEQQLGAAVVFQAPYFHADRPYDLPNVKCYTDTVQKSYGEGDEGSSAGSLLFNSNDSYSSSTANGFTPCDNISSYPPSSRSSSDDHNSGSKPVVGDKCSRSALPTRATLYSEIQALKYDAEMSKARIKVLDAISESMRADMEGARGMLAEHGDVLRTLVARRAKMISQKRTVDGGPLAQ